MTATARKSRRPAVSTATVRAETLTQFSALLDEHAGHPAGFAALVSELAQTRASVAHLKAARSVLFDQVKEAYLAGHRVIGATGYELRMTTPAEPITYRCVPSDVAKRASKAAWAAAQVPVRRVSVSAPGPEAARLDLIAATIEIPDLRTITTPAAAVLTYKDHPAWAMLKELRDTEIELIARLEKLAADFDWDGEPLSFADGWTAGLKRRQYSSERLAEVAPALFARLAVTKIAAPSAHVYVARQGDNEADDAVDLDGD